MKFAITLIPNNDKSLPYIINVEANNSESAVQKAKEFVAENGAFGLVKKEYIINHLSVVQIKTI